jgi:vacuolar protein sorting-associated protein 16
LKRRLKWVIHLLLNNQAPNQLVWCGEDAICANWNTEEDSTLIILGKYKIKTGNDNIFKTFSYDSNVYLIGGKLNNKKKESDCIKVIGNESCEIIERVPDYVLETFQLDSIEPPSLLYDSYKDFIKNESIKLKNIKKMREENTLEPAIRTILKISLFEFDVNVQKTLLQAASFGKNFLSFFIF